ncbi:MAG: hypothetical protein JNK46_20525 [Methylobacteriaceae bacterium]|nr:hypothetical protein [Methylobacteriaceae bacterium]
MAETGRLLRTIRLDPSDGFVFARAAEPGQWAVSGAFLFDGRDPDSLSTKARVALRSGLLGVADFGWSTLAVVVEASAAERAEAVETLARQLIAQCGAPDLDAALAAAQEEIDFSAGLADHPVGSLIAVRRSLEDGALREQFRMLARRPAGADRLHAGARAFAIVESDEAPDETVDLAGLIIGGAKDAR